MVAVAAFGWRLRLPARTRRGLLFCRRLLVLGLLHEFESFFEHRGAQFFCALGSLDLLNSESPGGSEPLGAFALDLLKNDVSDVLAHIL
jgi:hypothetical protein